MGFGLPFLFVSYMISVLKASNKGIKADSFIKEKDTSLYCAFSFKEDPRRAEEIIEQSPLET